MTYDQLAQALDSSRQSATPEYALLVPVIEEKGAFSLLFEVRSSTLRTQPGEVCFPGGRVEPGEDPAKAALREMGEELGLRPPMVELGPALAPEWHQSGYPVYPFLARLSPCWQEALAPERAEVDTVFSVPLDFFQTTAPELYVCEISTVPPPQFPYDKIGFPQGYPWRRGQVTIPLWMWRGRPIWGLTARVVRRLVNAL